MTAVDTSKQFLWAKPVFKNSQEESNKHLICSSASFK